MEEHLISNNNFVRKFTIAILGTIQKSKLKIEDAEIISSDLVVKLSNDLMKAISIKQEGIMKLISVHEEIGSLNKGEINKEGLKIIEKVNTDIILSQIPPKTSYISKMESTPVIGGRRIGMRKNIRRYGKIQTLLMDPLISMVQCLGPNQEIIIMKRGTKQITTISLSIGEIKDIFEQFSQESHIPLIEGPFSARVNDLNISGINSSMVGSSFVIKRVTT